MSTAGVHFLVGAATGSGWEWVCRPFRRFKIKLTASWRSRLAMLALFMILVGGSSLLGFESHFFTDALPHTEYQDMGFWIILALSFDVLVSMYVLAMLATSRGTGEFVCIVAGVLWVSIPDILAYTARFAELAGLRINWLAAYLAYHQAWHVVQPSRGYWEQLGVAVLAALFLMSRRRRARPLQQVKPKPAPEVSTELVGV